MAKNKNGRAASCRDQITYYKSREDLKKNIYSKFSKISVLFSNSN